MTKYRLHDVKWWYWLATALLLAVYSAGWRPAIFATIALGAVQVVHFTARAGDAAAFPVQVRAAYLALLGAGLVPPFGFIHWVQLAGTWLMVLVGYCALARALSLLPWNRRQPLSLAFVRRTFLAPPVRGCIVEAMNRPPAFAPGMAGAAP
ncbi:MAG TPA: hypothetical protein VH743_12285 [Beijerinckiaceae bacterium]|jgi:hypothetical protein